MAVFIYRKKDVST